jgi:hypothetical protein
MNWEKIFDQLFYIIICVAFCWSVTYTVTNIKREFDPNVTAEKLDNTIKQMNKVIVTVDNRLKALEAKKESVAKK